MKTIYFLLGLLFYSQTQAQTVLTYSTNGSGAFIVPSGVTSIFVEVWGAGGSGGRISSAA